MKPVIVVGNWKSNKTIEEAQTWIVAFSKHAGEIPENIRVIVCPAFHHLPLFLETKLPILLGVQDVSPFDSGAYTGEIAAPMIAGTVGYALLGHSERRKYFNETDEIIAEKAKQCLLKNIAPVVCVSEVAQAETLKKYVPDFAATGMLLYEPLFAIGSGTPDSPPNANAFALKLHHVFDRIPVLYGGSVAPENAASFISQEFISGVAVGKGSLDAEIFFQLIAAASSPS